MLFNTLHFVSLPIGQVKPKNNLPEAILAGIGQALISTPDVSKLQSSRIGINTGARIFQAQVSAQTFLA